ncbi:MAG TPA: hypothetical protein VNM90_29940 [Haliangium sp.]|nr:hypothetical protein [Haliangium sp.]
MRHSLLAISLAAALIAGCGSDSEPPEKDSLAESLSVWQDMKTADDGTYQYTRTSSSFSGVRTTTTFVVENDVVVRRTHEVYDADGTVIDSFDEQGDEVGSNTGAHPVYNVDELYQICRDDVLSQDPEKNQIILTFHEDGILETCVYVPLDCADDCDEGVDIATLDMSL